jgi:hypothetical protein
MPGKLAHPYTTPPFLIISLDKAAAAPPEELEKYSSISLCQPAKTVMGDFFSMG